MAIQIIPVPLKKPDVGGENRAASVNLSCQQGVDEETGWTATDSHGQDQPVADNKTAAGSAKIAGLK